ncbi:hypothetical protein BsWGS_23473 [Bradybaena similaris]
MEHQVDTRGPAVNVKTFVLFDTETTGLRSPGYNPHIMELCFIAVTREELLTKQKAPRVLNKLVICFNPGKKIGFKASEITGLYNDALEDLADFSKQTPLITTFLRNLPQPVCLIAHNGNWFDFPLLVSHLRCGSGEIPGDVLCTDSLEALRTFDGLPAVPEFLLKKKQANSLSSISLTADTQRINSLKESSETSGDKLKLNKSKNIESHDETNNIKTHQSRNDSSDNLKRNVETLEISYMNCKHAKVSPTHTVVWDRTEHTPSVSQMTKILGPESMNYSNLKKGSSEVKRNLFREDSSSGIESKQLGSDLLPDLGEKMIPAGEESVNFDQNICPKSVNDSFLFVEGTNNRNISFKNGTTKSDTSTVINSTSANYNTSFSTESQGNSGGLETAVKCVGEKAANSPVVAQNHNRLGKSVNKFRNIHTPEKLSYSLQNVYVRMFGHQPSACHTAEGDCLALLEILHSKQAEFVSWCDSCAVPLMNISPMY